MKTTLTLMNSVATLNSGARKSIRATYLGLLLSLLTLSFFVQAQTPHVVTTLGNVSGCPGQDVLVPVNVTGFSNITGVSLTIRYDTSQLTGISIQNLNPAVNNNFLSFFSITGDSGYLAIAAYTVSGSMTIPDGGLMLNIKFNVKNKPLYAGVTFDLDHYGVCEYADNTPGTPMPIPSTPADWVNGSVYTQPSFSLNPSNVLITPGSNGYFFVNTMGNNTYQWQISTTNPVAWSNLSTGGVYGDVTNDTLFITNATIGMNGYKYRCVATSVSGGCPSPYNVANSNAVTLTVSSPCPTVYNITGGGSYCAGTGGVHIFLSGSEIGVNYQLKLNGTNTGTPVAGTGSVLDFGLITAVGNYTAVGINSNACSPQAMSGSVSVATYNTTSGNVTTNSPPGGVCGGAVAALTFHLNGLKPFSYTYSDGTNNYTLGMITHNDTTIFVNPLVTTTYTLVSATNGNGCALNITGSPAQVVVKPTPVAVASSNSPICSGGTINLSSAGTTGALTLSWTFGSTTLTGNNPSIPNATTANSGVYTLLATGSNACTATATTTVVVNTTPSAAGSITGPGSVCELTTQTYSVGNIAGATSYVWTVPAGASITSGDGTGTIQVTFSASAVNGNITVMGHSDCGDGSMATLPVIVSDAPAATASNSGPVCVGASFTLNAGGVGLYAWSGPLSFSSSSQNPSLSNATLAMAGTYTVTVTGATGCANTASTTVVVNANPVATIGASPNPVCSGSLLSLSSGGGNTYLWSGPSSYSSTQQNPAFLANLGSQGTYFVTVTNTSTNCKATNSVAVTVNTAPTVSASNNNPCEGTTLILASSGGVGYSWSGPGGFSSNLQNPSIANVTNAAAGTYTVLVTAANGCSKAGTTVVSIKANPSPITATSNSPVCEGGSITLSSTGGVNYAWSGPSLFSSSLQNPDPITNAASANAGTYTVTVTGSNGCSANTSTTVVVNAKPVANAGTDQTIPLNQTTTLSGSALGGSGSYAWNWQPAASLVNNSVQNPTTVALSANTTFTLTATDAITGCVSAQSSVNVNVAATLPLAASISVSPYPTFCTGANLSFSANATGGSGTYSYTWSGPNGFSSTEQNPQIIAASASAAGTYNLTVSDGVTSVVATPVSLNSASASQVYTVGTSGSYCQGTSGLPVTLSGSDLGVSYQLYKNGAVSGSPLSGNGSALNFGNQTAGTFTVVGSNLCGIISMDGSAIITETALPVVYTVGGGGAVCAEFSANITLSGTEDGVAYSVFHNGFTTPYNFTGNGNAYTFAVYAAGTYTIAATNNCGTVNMNSSAVVTEILLPASFTVSGGGNFCQFTSGIVSLSGSEISASYELYKDGIATGSILPGTGAALSFTVTETGIYTIFGTNTCGTTQMSGDANFVLVSPPAVFAVTGGSSSPSCTVQEYPVGLAGSETGVLYTLYVNGLATSNSINGTGLALNFGIFTEAGTYSVVAVNATGCIANMANSVSIIYLSNPAIVIEPVNAVINAGDNTGFIVIASNATAYAWYESNDGGINWTMLTDGGVYSGTSTAALSLTAVPYSMNNYSYKCIVSNGDCQASTLAASLTVNQVVVTTTISLTQMTFCPGTVVVPVYVQNFDGVAALSLVFDFNASALTYTGYQNVNAGLEDPSNIVINQTGGSLSISHYVTDTASEIGDGILLELVFQYFGGNTGLTWDLSTPGNCELADINTNILSSAYVNGSITANGTSPVITAQPANASTYSGFNASFHVTAAGASSYQWQTYTTDWVNLSNNAPYSGVNTADLMITGASLTMNGNLYRVIVTESGCNLSAVSSQAQLTVTTSTIDFITTAANVESCIGPNGTAAVSVAAMPNVSAISLTLNYNPSVLDNVSYTNLNSLLSGGNITVNNTPGEWKFSWYQITPVSILSGTLFDLTFDYLGGSTDLSWDLATAGNCEYNDSDGNIIPAIFVNGHVGPSPYQAAITSNPVSVTVFDGNNASFSITATNALTYQWQISADGLAWTDLANAGAYSGVNTATLDITAASVTMNGSKFRCVVNGATCAEVSAMATLTVNYVVQNIITTAGTVSGCNGNQVIVPVSVQYAYNVAAISLTLQYNPSTLTFASYDNLNSQLVGGSINTFDLPGEWRFSWYSIAPVNIGSGNLFDLHFTYLGGNSDLVWDLATSGNCEYDDFDGNILPAVYVNGHVGASASQAVITGQPSNVSVIDGDNASFTVVATGANTYQWQISTDGATWTNLSDGGNYSGVTTATLNISPAVITMNGYDYRVLINASDCPVLSEAANLNVTPFGGTIITTAGSANGCTGIEATIPVNVQYLYNCAAISLTLNYDPTVISYINYSNLNSQLSTTNLNIFELPGEWKFSWYSLTPVNIGSDKLFDLTFDYLGGSTDLVWNLSVPGFCEYNDFDGNTLPAVYVNGHVGPSTSQPVINTQPAPVSVVDGTNATFSVTATNASAYQWQVSTDGGLNWTSIADGGIYSGATTANLAITPATILMDGYQYRVWINGVDCSLYSQAASLDVTPVLSPIITTAGNALGCPNYGVIVPVNGQYIYDIAALSLTLLYNPAVLEYTGYHNLNAQLSTGSLNIFNVPGEWRMSWYSITPMNIGSAKLVDLDFTYLGGYTDLTWDLSVSGNCEYDDFNGNMLAANYVNGSVGPNGDVPVLTTQPADLTVNHGDIANFHVVATNATTYQWQVSNNGGSSWANLANNAYYSGVNTADLTVLNAIYFFNGYQYRCEVSNAFCATLTSAATLTVNPDLPWTVTTYAPVMNECPGTDIVVPITVTDFYDIAANSLTLNYNSTVLTYNGYQNLNPAMADALISPTAGEFKFSWYTLSPLSLGDATLVELLFTYNGGSTDLSWDLVTPGNCEYNDFNGNVLPSAYVNGSVGSYALAPVINTQPSSLTSFVGAPPVTFSVDASNATAYQWQVSNDGGSSWANLTNVAPYSGVNTSVLEIGTLSLDLSGLQYRVVINGTCGLNVTSDAATLTVYSLIVTTAGSVTECATNNVIVPITVEHVYNVGAVSLTLDYNAAELTYTGYQDLHPSIDPTTLLVNASNGQVKISYTSLSPLNFGDGQLLSLVFTSTGTNSTLSWDNVTPGNCEWVDFNTYAIINSLYNNGSIVVYPLAYITSDPTSVSLDETGNTSFTVGAANAVSYQWQVSADGGLNWTNLADGGVYSGVYTSTLVLSGITLDMNAYQYRAIAIAGGNCEPFGYSAAATLTVTPIIRTIAGDVVSCAANTIIVPVNVEHLYGVGAVSLSLNYDATNLTYVGYQDANSLLDPTVLTVNATGGQVKIGYFTASSLDLGNALMLNLVFSSNGGYSALTWDVVTPSNCEYINTTGGVITSQYVNGSLTVNPLPVITFNNYGPYCIDASPVTLEALPAGGSFSGAGVTGSTFDPAAAGAGTWPVTYTFTDGNGCTNSSTILVVVNPLPVVTIETAGPFCINETYTLVGTPAGGTFSGPGVIGDTFNPALTGLGTFTITYTYTDANGCTNFTSTNVVVNDIPVVTIGALGVYCNNEAPVLLTGTPSGGTFSGPGVVGDMFDPSLAGPGTWTVTYTYTDGNVCTNFATTQVLVNQVPTAFPVFGGGEYCSGGTGLNVGTGGSEAGFQYYLYLNGVNTGQVKIGTGSILNFGLQTLAGTYTIYAMNPGTGCNNWLAGSVEVIINPLPVVYGGGYSIICQGSGATLNATVIGGTAPYLYNWTPATGLSNANVLNPVASPQTTTFYQIVVTDAKGCTATDNALIVVNAAPVVSAGPDMTINAGMIVPINATVSGGHAPYSYLWTPSTGLNNANVLSPLASPTVTTTYTLVVTDNLGCTGTDQVTITVTSVPLGYNISGFVTYDNLLNSPMKNTNVLLKQSNVTVNTAVTDLAGSYGFSIIPNGSYTLTGQTNKAWGGGNSVDALLMARHFVGLQSLTGLRLLAGDLNGDGIVNAADALLVMRRSVVMINSFVVGDWIFETKNALVNNGNLSIDFKALCYGDVNGSNVNIPALKVSPSVSIETRGIQTITGAGDFELPIRAGHNLAVGAASLAISFNADAVEVLGVDVSGNSKTSNLVYQVQDGVLYVEWYNLNGLELNSDENLFTLKLGVKDVNALSNLQFAVSVESQLGDPNANVLEQTTLTVPKLQLASGLFALSANYPNPFNQSTTISYTIPENGKVNLSIYNLIGEKIAEVVNAAQDAGTYSVTLDGTSLQQGVYTYRLVVNGKSDNYEQSKRMIVTR